MAEDWNEWTQLAHGCIDNDEGLNAIVEELAPNAGEYELARELEAAYYGLLDGVPYPAHDIAAEALSRVEWDKLARAYKADLD